MVKSWPQLIRIGSQVIIFATMRYKSAKKKIKNFLEEQILHLKELVMIDPSHSTRNYPSMLVLPYVLFNPTTPQREEGIRIEPAVFQNFKKYIAYKKICQTISLIHLICTTSTISSQCSRTYSRSNNCSWTWRRATSIPIRCMRISCSSATQEKSVERSTGRFWWKQENTSKPKQFSRLC